MNDHNYGEKEHAGSNVTENGHEAINVHVGSRVKLRRRILGITQKTLGDALGLTFQQVQKYESGVNRIGASRLYYLSVVLDVPIAYFFEELHSPLSKKREVENMPKTERSGDDTIKMLTKETIELVHSYYQIKDRKVRDRILELTKQLGNFSSHD